MGKVKKERRGRNREAESGEKTVFREINLPSDPAAGGERGGRVFHMRGFIHNHTGTFQNVRVF